MNDTDFEKALQAVFDEQCREIDNADIPQYEFSDKFEKKMNRIIRKRKKPVMRAFRKAFIRAVACAASAVLVTVSILSSKNSLFTGDTSRLHILNFYIELNNNDTDYEFHIDILDEDAPETIEELYEITYDLSDFQFDWDSMQYSWYDYKRETYYDMQVSNDERVLFFVQHTKPGLNVALNTEGAEFEIVQLDDCEAVFFRNHVDLNYLLWEGEDYIFYLISEGLNGNEPFGKNELIDIANSVQKVEK